MQDPKLHSFKTKVVRCRPVQEKLSFWKTLDIFLILYINIMYFLNVISYINIHYLEFTN